MINTEIDRLFEVVIPIYNDKVIISYGNNIEFLIHAFKDQPDWKKKMRKSMITNIKQIFKDKPYKNGARYSYHNTLDIHHIHIFQEHNMSKLIGTLSHEVLHYVIYLLQIRGFTLTDSSEEAYTYLQGYITEEIIKQMSSDL